MLIFCSDVNRASQEKLVPITRQNSDSIVPDKTVITLELAVVSPENGPFWELEAEQSQQVACEDAPSPKRDTSDVKKIKKGRPYHNKREAAFGVQRCIADWREAHSLPEARIL